MENTSIEELAKELTSMIDKGVECNSTLIISGLNDFQEIVQQLGDLNIDDSLEDNELKNRFLEIVTLYLNMLHNINNIMYKRNNNKISHHILIKRVVNTMNGLKHKPKSIVVNKSRVFLDINMETLSILVTMLSHNMFQVQSSPVLVNQSNFENTDIDTIYKSCNEIMSILTIIWVLYFSKDATVNNFLQDIKKYIS